MIFSPVRGEGFELLESISSSSKHTLLYSDEYQKSILRWIAREANFGNEN